MQKWAIISMSLRNLLLLLVFFSALFCHRIYSTFFILEGDAVQNVYFWANSYLVNTGYDENLRDYFPLMSMNIDTIIALIMQAIRKYSKIRLSFSNSSLASAIFLVEFIHPINPVINRKITGSPKQLSLSWKCMSFINIQSLDMSPLNSDRIE